MRALITGANGFVGQALYRRLVADDVDIFTIGRRAEASPRGRHFAFGDSLWTSSQWYAALDASQPDVVYHLAGKFRGATDELAAVNYGLISTLLPVLRATNSPPALLVVGSAAECGRAFIDGEPTSETLICQPVPGSYGESKLLQTQAVLRYAEETGARAIVARVFNAIGPGMSSTLALGDFAAQIAIMSRSCGVMRTGNVDVSRDFITGATTADILVRLGGIPNASGLINICSGVAFHLRPLIERMIARSGKSIRLEVDPARLRPGEPNVIVGANARLTSLGLRPPVEDMGAVADSILEHAVASLASA